MGILTKLAMLPLAPVGGVIWLAEVLQQEAEGELYGPSSIRQQLAELEARHDRGEISADEWEVAAEELLAHFSDHGRPFEEPL